MSVHRIDKKGNFTTMSNNHLRNEDLSFKARGILSTMLSLPDDWEYTLAGLAKLAKDGITSVRAGVVELEEMGYLVRRQDKAENGTYANTINSENKLASAVNPEKTKSNLPKAGKKTSGIGYKTDRKSKNSRKNTESNVFSYGTEAVGNSVETGIKNSDDNGLKTMGAVVGAAVTTAEILKPEDVTPPKRKKFDKAKTGKQAAALGIKNESVGYLKTAVLQAEKSSEKAIRAAGSSVLGIIKSDIEEKAENNLAFKAVDDTIKTIDTAVAVEKGITSAVNTGVTVNKVIKESGKAVITAPRYLKNKVKRIQKLMRMKRTAQYKLAGKSVKEAAKTTADIIVSSAKDAAIKLGAVMLLCVVLVVMVCGAVFAAIGSFIWQTPTELDTTQILKYISELDTKQQTNWYKGKTGVDIAKRNSGDPRKYEYYHYLIAVDVPPDIPDTAFNCCVTVGVNSRGEEISPSFSGFNKSFSSCDEMLECFQWTTDDYRAALAYLQVKNENLGWLASTFGWIGEYQLEKAARELHELTYKQYIVVENRHSDGTSDYNYVYPIYNTTYSSDTAKHTYYFGRKYSVKYLIDNGIIRFSDDDAENKVMKERFDYTYKYGNFAVSMLSFPLELSSDEKISDRITKHFGKQLSLKYTPPEHPDDSDKDVFGTVSKNETYHYATDISADDGDIIFSPITGLCKVTQRDERGYEYVISTSYTGNDFDFTKSGYLVKISCSSSTFISPGTPTEVTQGNSIGKVAHNTSANYNISPKDNDSENEDIFADKLFPCSASTDYHSIEENEFDIPEPSTDHIHMELYKLPCDFTDANSIEENVLAPELFFDYSNETDE